MVKLTDSDEGILQYLVWQLLHKLSMPAEVYRGALTSKLVELSSLNLTSSLRKFTVALGQPYLYTTKSS